MGTRKRKDRIAVLTSCTITRAIPAIVEIEKAPVVPTMKELAIWWAKKIQSHKADITPGEIYGGVSFDTITEMTQEIDREHFYIITGGYGLLSLTQKMVPYDFTHNKNYQSNAHQHVTSEKFLPHVWWTLINELICREPHPISKLTQKYDYVVGALPIGFIKYILDDLKYIHPDMLRDKVFIPLPRSNIAHIPKALRDAFVPYNSDYAEGLGANRYNKTQKVLQKFLRLSSEASSIREYAEAISGEVQSIHDAQGVKVDYDAMFREHPDLLDCDDAAHAIQVAKRRGLKIGGKHKFAGIWIGTKGTISINAPKAHIKSAVSTLKGIMEKSKTKNKGVSDLFLERLGLFVAAARELPPNTIFLSKEVAQWGVISFGKDTPDITNTTKISWTLSFYAKYLGLQQVQLGSGGYGYQVLENKI